MFFIFISIKVQYSIFVLWEGIEKIFFMRKLSRLSWMCKNKRVRKKILPGQKLYRSNIKILYPLVRPAVRWCRHGTSDSWSPNRRNNLL